MTFHLILIQDLEDTLLNLNSRFQRDFDHFELKISTRLCLI